MASHLLWEHSGSGKPKEFGGNTINLGQGGTAIKHASLINYMDYDSES